MKSMDENKFKLITFASNKNGTKIFCRLAFNKKTIIKGFYDFNKEKFIITDYLKKNFTQGINRKIAEANLKEILDIDYGWNV